MKKAVKQTFHLESKTRKESKGATPPHPPLLYKVNEHMLWHGTLYEHYLFFNIMQMHFQNFKNQENKVFFEAIWNKLILLLYLFMAYNKHFDCHNNE